jgi:UDP-GlcNAc:undecaprenyl-phosphate/decaprenyl-phosphate GlcNAc-1-phosphate transferase
MLAAMLVALILSLFTSLLLIRYLHVHQRFTADRTEGPQKFHLGIPPRVGGIALFIGLVGGAIVAAVKGILPGAFLWKWLAALAPVFLAGLAEDLTKVILPGWRLFASFLSAGIGCWLLGAVINRLDIAGLNTLLITVPAVAIIITIIAVGGICHAFNLIDGYNGLVGGVASMVFFALSYVCFLVGDLQLLAVCLISGATVVGFLVWNYPKGLIFAGDAGAYMLGFLIAGVSVLLVARHPQVSPWFPFTLVIYPVWETLFTIYRRKVIQGQATGLPDTLHLHQIVFSRLVRWMVGRREAKHLLRRNSMTAPYLWGMGLITIVPALLFWGQTIILQIWCACFISFYVWLYRRIVRFRAPKWLILRNTSYLHARRHVIVKAAHREPAMLKLNIK